jgi:4-aminobutyrate aminotransferase
VSQAAAKQCMELVHGQCSIAFHDPYLRLIEKLLPMMPHKSLNSFFFWNSGTEAVEAAIKMVRIMTGKQNIIAMQGKNFVYIYLFSLLIDITSGGYHGRTFGAMALTKSKISYSEGNHPLMVGLKLQYFPKRSKLYEDGGISYPISILASTWSTNHSD